VANISADTPKSAAMATWLEMVRIEKGGIRLNTAAKITRYKIRVNREPGR